jgi:protein-tyrosine phosphatase
MSLEAIESDWHCHILPKIDDGVQQIEESLAMLRLYESLGIKKIVATPHIRGDFYPNTRQTIAAAHQKLQQESDKEGLKITLQYAAEYYADDNFLNLIANNDLLTIENQYVLFELPLNQAPLFAKTIPEKIQKLGYTPVLAHPERYRYWHGKMQDIRYWKDMGVYFQLNLLSLVGHYGSAERKTAEALLDADYIDAVGTDAHGMRHLEQLQKLADNQYFEALKQIPLLNRID